MGGKYSGYNYFAGTKAEGAMSDGTSVAVMLRLCEYFAGKTDELTVDINFVFYGMGCYDYYGARDTTAVSGKRAEAIYGLPLLWII